ncbi:segregation/condensation protein A [Candidatus Woesearchaeota archaeon]|nr:segregation/condensation protein A [Candidatus Woesearchaeota archaeon]
MEDRILEIVVQKDEVTWQNMLLDLVKTEGMDPWNINISLLTGKYLDMLKKLKQLDFRISGKMVLAAAILLRMKTKRLVGEDLMELDRLMRTENEPDMADDFYGELEQGSQQAQPGEIPQLTPRTPQPRSRKVSIYDLMNALQKALEVRDRRVLRRPVITLKLPERKVDITKLTVSVWERILAMGTGKVMFSQLAPEQRMDKILLFISLLYLANSDQRKLDLVQQEPFMDFDIVIRVPETKAAEAAQAKPESAPEPLPEAA